MVTPDALDALDFLVWLNSGYRAAELCGCHQSSISRRAQEAADVFGVTLIRDRAGWELEGSTVLLDLEREVHQLHRLLRGSELRLELAPELVGFLPQLADSAWIAVLAETAQPEHSWSLVERRVIDGWLTDHHPAVIDWRDGVVACPLRGGMADGGVLVVRRELAGHPVFDRLQAVLCGNGQDEALPARKGGARSSARST